MLEDRKKDCTEIKGENRNRAVEHSNSAQDGWKNSLIRKLPAAEIRDSLPRQESAIQ
jgi:hypothetical protein